MLMALLYNDNNEVIAAAPACDQVPIGQQYWLELHESSVKTVDIFETAYVTIMNPNLRDQLLLLGIDQSINGCEMARLVELNAAPNYIPHKAA